MDSLSRHLKEAYQKIEETRNAISLLNKIYTKVAVSGDMKKEFGSITSTLNHNGQNIRVWTEGGDKRLFIPSVIDVKWNGKGVHNGLYKTGDPNTVVDLWNSLNDNPTG